MKLFLDTASIEEIRTANRWGVLGGVTTNPSLLAREHAAPETVWKEILTEVHGDVSLEVTALDADGMVEQGHTLAQMGPNAVVKVPMTPEGLEAASRLRAESIRTNITLVFSAAQAILAAKAGASFISPFLGRLDDIGENGLLLLQDIIEVYRNYDWKTEVLAASMRHPIHVIEAARMGADIATIPFKVIDQMFNHPLTDKGQATFLADWHKSGRK